MLFVLFSSLSFLWFSVAVSEMSAKRSGNPRSVSPKPSLEHQESVAAFVKKLWEILDKTEYYELIAWSDVSDSGGVE